jgi:hypothetical protein
MNRDEQLKLEHATILEEYRSLKTEIVSNLDSARQIANLALAATGILIGAVPFIQSQALLIFLIAPLFFYALAWSQLRYVYLVLDMGDYLGTTLIPRIREILVEISIDKEERLNKVMSWQTPGKGPTRLRPTRRHGLLFFPIAGANYGIPLLTALLSNCAFLYLAYRNAHVVSWFEWILIACNFLAMAYSVYWGLQAELRR